jgi:ubiquinone/menaquinone biosynthesis C-methylase UbiE
MVIKDYYEEYWENGGYSSKVDIFCKYKKIYIENNIAASNKRILDIGCGDGEFSSLLLNNNNEIIGLDISENAVKIAQGRRIKAKYCDINYGLPFEDSSFDIVLIFDTLEHIFDPSFTLREAQRVLKRGGSLYCDVPNAGFLLNRLYFLFTGCFKDFTALSHKIIPDKFFSEHIRFFSPQIIKSLLNKNHFLIKKIDYWFPTYFQNYPYNKLSFIGKIIKFSKLEKLFPNLLSTSIFIESIKL